MLNKAHKYWILLINLITLINPFFAYGCYVDTKGRTIKNKSFALYFFWVLVCLPRQIFVFLSLSKSNVRAFYLFQTEHEFIKQWQRKN